jgi:phosphatidate cytidylyltransferase
MTDDWNRRDNSREQKRDDTGDYGTDFGDDFGTVQFADDDAPALSFGDDTGPLPHWTEPPTSEIPRVPAPDAPADDVWSTFSRPAVQPDQTPPTVGGLFDDLAPEPAYRDEPTREARYFDDSPVTSPIDMPITAPTARQEPPRREPRLVIGSDPTDERLRRPDMRPGAAPSRPTQRPAPVVRGARPTPTRRPAGASGGVGGRGLPQAVTAGLLLAAAFIAALMWRPAAVMVFVVAVVGLAAVEFFDKVTEKGYRPATIAGIAACVAAPLAAYWMGDAALPLVFTFAFMAAAIGFIGANGVQSGPLPNIAITTLAVVWIGLLGSFGALLVRYSTFGLGVSGFNVGTDTLFIVAAGVVANDVVALFVGSAAGRTPLREWISPSKSVEGLIGGTVGTFVAVLIIGTQSDTWNRTSEWLLMAIVISVLAPLGDLVESMFKRNLDIKDFGTIIRGHGGVLDRFDGFLFVLPGAYYLTLVIQPWVS